MNKFFLAKYNIAVLTGYEETRRTAVYWTIFFFNRDTEHYPWHPICPSVTFLLLERWGIDQRVCPSDLCSSKLPHFPNTAETLAEEATALQLLCLLQIMTLDRYLKAPRGVKRGTKQGKMVLVACRLKASSVGDFVISFYSRCCKYYLKFQVPMRGRNENLYLYSLW